jgi:hypothetical protein
LSGVHDAKWYGLPSAALMASSAALSPEWHRSLLEESADADDDAAARNRRTKAKERIAVVVSIFILILVGIAAAS